MPRFKAIGAIDLILSPNGDRKHVNFRIYVRNEFSFACGVF